MNKLDPEEKEILEAFERNELKSIINKDEELKRHRDYAAATFKQDKIINIPISERDLRTLQKRALSEGVPCEMLVSSIIHKYLEGYLIDKNVKAV